MLDQHWREHLAAMDYLRQGIHLRGYAQKDYRFEFKREAFELFSAMLDRIKFETSSLMARSKCAPRRKSTARRKSAAAASCARCRRSTPRPPRSSRAEEQQTAVAAGVRGLHTAGVSPARAGRAGGAAAGGAVTRDRRHIRARRAQGGTQRAVSVRFGQEVQALSRCALER